MLNNYEARTTSNKISKEMASRHLRPPKDCILTDPLDKGKGQTLRTEIGDVLSREIK